MSGARSTPTTNFATGPAAREAAPVPHPTSRSTSSPVRWTAARDACWTGSRHRDVAPPSYLPARRSNHRREATLEGSIGSSVHVALDGSLVAHLRLIGIEPRIPPGAPLMEEIPRLVQGDLQMPQTLDVRFRGLASRLFLEQLVLFRCELVDPLQDVLVFHGAPPSDDPTLQTPGRKPASNHIRWHRDSSPSTCAYSRQDTNPSVAGEEVSRVRLHRTRPTGLLGPREPTSRSDPQLPTRSPLASAAADTYRRSTFMQALRIANYKVIKGTFPELAEEAKGDMLETFKRQPGFIRYGLADTGEGTCVSISLWETHAQADAATPVAATWIREHLADRVELRSSQVGDLAFYEGARAAV